MQLQSLRKLMLHTCIAAALSAGLANAATAANGNGNGAANGHGNGNGNGNAATNSHGNGRHLVQNGRSEFKGNLKTSRHIYYPGDELDISVQFTRGDQLLDDGEVDAHIVMFSFDGSVIVVPVPSDIGTASRKFFHIDHVDISSLPEGQYQLGLVLTVPDGDPALLEDWSGGFRALLDTEAVYVSATQLESDDDGDGEHDNDTDGDGIEGEEDDEADDDGDKG